MYQRKNNQTNRLLLLFVSIGRYLRIREQQKIISQETQRQEEEIRLQKKQLQHQHLEEQHHRQASEYQFESNEIDGTASQQQVSTPIQSSQIRAGYFDRENPFRKSDRVGENLQKPTPADKTRYFQEKQTTELRSGKQQAGDRIEKRLDMEEISAIEASDTENEAPKRGTVSDKMKMLYSTVKKTTPKEENPFYKERIRTFELQSEEGLARNFGVLYQGCWIYFFGKVNICCDF